MRFLIISENGDGAGIAWKLKQEGNEVAMYLKNPSTRMTLKNIIPHVRSIREGVNLKPDVI